MKKWNLLNNSNPRKEKLLNILLENRGINGQQKQKDFLNPKLSSITVQSVGINKFELQKSIKRIKKAIDNKEEIIVFGDYDVDGICGSAILWETLIEIGAKTMPYIPSRFEEGYGLSIKGIKNLLSKNSDIKLIITVDNGIVANDAVDFANKQGIDVIITDHHLPAKVLPKAYSVVHTTELCGAGVAYILSKQLKNEKIETEDSHLELVVLATIADLVPLKDANRILVYFGLKSLRNTKRLGLLALFRQASIEKDNIGVFEVGYIIAPRLNAAGRLESAMDSLRLICTANIQRAEMLAKNLSEINFERRQFTNDALIHAKNKAKDKLLNKLIFIADESYQQGVVGLVAGRLVEEFYLPSIVISKGKTLSRASVRSVKGFNIIEFLRQASDLLVDVGGHPMAAGFTVETKNLDLLEKKLYELAAKLINKDHLERKLNIDVELLDELINIQTLDTIQKLAPFGMANPEPIFLTKNLKVESIKAVGKDGNHLKLKLISNNSSYFDAIAFGMGLKNTIQIGDKVDAAYTLDENEWNGNKKLQLEAKDIKLSV